jgi:hypothetical protein
LYILNGFSFIKISFLPGMIDLRGNGSKVA